MYIMFYMLNFNQTFVVAKFRIYDNIIIVIDQ